MSVQVKWLALENEDATRTCKQHAYIPAIRKMRYTLEPYEGNKTLCSKRYASEDGETAQNFNNMESEPQSEDCCKKCRKIYERLSKR